MKCTGYLLPGILLYLFFRCSSSPVVDSDGNPVTPDALYNIRKSGSGLLAGHALTLRPFKGSSCPDHVAFSKSQADPGIAVRFLPYRSNHSFVLGDRFQVESMSLNWTVDGKYVIVRDNANSFFEFSEGPLTAKGSYTLSFCGSCPLCRNLCNPVGLDGEAFPKYWPFLVPPLDIVPMRIHLTKI